MQHFAEIQRLDLFGLVCARKGEELLQRPRAILSCAHDDRNQRFDDLRLDGAPGQLLRCELAIACDQGELLVEVVSDAARHLTQRAQLLGVGQRRALPLGLFALGDIQHHAQDSARATSRFGRGAGATSKPERDAVRVDDAEFHLARHVLHGRAQAAVNQSAIIGMDQVQQLAPQVRLLFRRLTKQALGSGGPAE